MAEAESKGKRNFRIPLAGGKGGTGKSVLTANLGPALARLGYKTLLVDLDLGGSNLHTLLGLKNTKDGLGRVLATKGMSLEEVVHDTPWSGLSYIPGDNQVLYTANPAHLQKRKIVEGLKRLPCDLLLADLGAGSSFNQMDFFLLSPAGLVVFTPEMTSLLNAYFFLRQTLFRALAQIFRDNQYASLVLEEYRARPGAGPRSWTMADLRESLVREAPGQELRMDKVLGWWQPGLVINQVHGEADLKALADLVRLSRAKLSLEPRIMGALPFDPAVRESVRERRPVCLACPDSPFSQSLGSLAARLPFWQPVPFKKLAEQARTWKPVRT